jgi:4-diphosphocytidyl-2-C-methyl-D-erythritol kinase
VRYFAPAKVNLALHVTGRREDGYHLLDSLVVFAGVGDWLEIREAPELRLAVTGPRSGGVPTDRSNLVWRAAEAFGIDAGAAIALEKHLPHAGGIGGGSADAGAALRGLVELWDVAPPGLDALLAIGADTPVCAACAPARMRGIGDILDPVPPIPPLWLVLANPGVEVPTGPVFKALASVENAPMPSRNGPMRTACCDGLPGPGMTSNRLLARWFRPSGMSSMRWAGWRDAVWRG